MHTEFRLVILVFCCRNQIAPEYLAREQQWEVESRRRLRSASSQRLGVRRTRLRTADDRAFSAAAPRLWNSLPANVVASQWLATVKERLKHFGTNSRLTADFVSPALASTWLTAG